MFRNELELISWLIWCHSSFRRWSGFELWFVPFLNPTTPLVLSSSLPKAHSPPPPPLSLAHPHPPHPGCPQKWAYQEKIGAYLLRQPETVRDLVRAAKDRLGWNYPVSIKIRVDSDQKMTERLVETAIQVGISHLTIHGRTRQTVSSSFELSFWFALTRSHLFSVSLSLSLSPSPLVLSITSFVLQASTQPVDLPAIAFANSLVNGRVPTVANGDAWTYEDVQNIRAQTGVQGVMAARGLLANPVSLLLLSPTKRNERTNVSFEPKPQT